MFDLNTLPVLNSGSRSKSWHLRLSDVRGHHNADFGPLTQVLTESMYICHRIHQNIMEQLWLMDVINLILLLFLLLGMILVIYHWYLNIAPYSKHVLHLWFQSWSWSWSLVGWRRTGGRASWAGTVGYRELSDGGAGHLQGPQSSTYLLVQPVMCEMREGDSMSKGFRFQATFSMCYWHMPLDTG